MSHILTKPTAPVPANPPGVANLDLATISQARAPTRLNRRSSGLPIRISAPRFLILGVVSVALLVGCAERIQVDGFTLVKAAVDKDFAAVTNRASFEFPCPKEQLRLVVLNVLPYNNVFANQIGVSGCGRKAVYVQTFQGWVMNNETDSSKPK